MKKTRYTAVETTKQARRAAAARKKEEKKAQKLLSKSKETVESVDFEAEEEPEAEVAVAPSAQISTDSETRPNKRRAKRERKPLATNGKLNKAKESYNALDAKHKKVFWAAVAGVLAVVALCVGMSAKPEAAKKVAAVDVVTADIQQTITVSGTVVSSNKSLYKAANGALVKEVLVKVGDIVAEGQQLATFDTAALAGKVEEKEQAYNQSKQTYEDSVVQAEIAAKELPAVNKRIAEIQAELAAKNALSDFSVEDILSDFSLEKLTEIFSGIGATLSSAFDFKSVFGMGYSDLESELIELQARKIVLDSQASNSMKNVYFSLMNSTLAEFENYKAALEAMNAGWVAKEAGVVTKVNIEAGKAFSVADAAEEFDINEVISGLQAGVNVEALLSGAAASDLADGIVVDNYSGFEVEFNINQYDIPKVAIGQEVVVNVINSKTEYLGTVSYISPVMSDGSSTGMDISSITGSLMGTGASGLDARAKITNPDKNVIIGMNVDMEIKTANVASAIAVPIEAIYIEGNEFYVFVIEKNRARKQKLEIGISSTTMYQVVSGCEVGDKLVKNPSSSLEAGGRIKIDTSK